MQDMAFTFPEQGGQVPTAAQRSRRRASMQDALDHTKINTSLYEKAVSPFHASAGIPHISCHF